MNVYDRVVPNLGLETLWSSLSGVSVVFGFDLLMRIFALTSSMSPANAST